MKSFASTSALCAALFVWLNGGLWAGTTIETSVPVYLPRVTCGAPDLAFRIGSALSLPVGVEVARPDDCNRRTGEKTQVAYDLIGMSKEDALRTLSEYDGRYRWTEDAGVLVGRPINSVSDPHDFLNWPRGHAFSVHEVRLQAALFELGTMLGPWRFVADGSSSRRGTTPLLETRISLEIADGTVLEAFNAIVASHGAAGWSISYCSDVGTIDTATFSIATFDGSGVGLRIIAPEADQRPGCN